MQLSKYVLGGIDIMEVKLPRTIKFVKKGKELIDQIKKYKEEKLTATFIETVRC